MKLTHLQAIAQYLNRFDYITKARRVADNTIELSLKGLTPLKSSSRQNDKQENIKVTESSTQNPTLYPLPATRSNSTNSKNCSLLTAHCSLFFDLTRGHSTIYIAQSQRPQQSYNAPFDILLQSLVAKAKLLRVEMPPNDRILRFHLAPKSSYKDRQIVLQLEFTGRNTNAILLDKQGVVIEALRHIDSSKSYRIVQPGVELADLPSRGLTSDDSTLVLSSAGLTPLIQNPTHYNEIQQNQVIHDSSFRDESQITRPLTDIENLLIDNYHTLHAKKLEQSKKNKITATKKQIAKFDRLLKKLSDSEKLLKQSEKYQNIANIVLSNLHRIKPYDKVLEVEDFEGNPIKIDIPPNVPTNRLGEYYFNLSKRAKAKAQNIHIERENLESKKIFYENILNAIENATDLYELDLLVPKRAKSLRKKEKIKEGELFWIEDYKVIVGRNSVENQHLLKIAKANDLWMHVRGVPSSHVLIKTDKQNLPESVIQAAAKLCVDFSIKNPGDYDVDYTKRKFVKIQEGSRVEYDKYQTIRVRKEGVEIRS